MDVPGLSDEDRLILEAASGARALTADEVAGIVGHVAGAGFDPAVHRGRTAAERHYRKHVVDFQEWPDGTSLASYLASIDAVVRDGRSGLFTSRYRGAYQLGIVRRTYDLRGPRGLEYVLVEYRLDVGFWVTAYQIVGLRDLQGPPRTELRWLRQPG